MAQGKKPDYKVLVSREGNGKNYYTQIGVGWLVAKEGISLQLDALPVGGKCVMFPFETQTDE